MSVFLDLLRRRNEPLLRAAVELHQRGEIPANTYVLDLDAIGANAALIAQEASRLRLRAYAMTKQLGRNPLAIQTIARNGIGAGVAVDMDCARALDRGGARVGHLGHLVQVPRREAGEAAALRPEHWTVFNAEKAQEASAAAAERDGVQPLLARVHDDGDRFYPGHEGGFPAAEIEQVADAFDALAGGRFAGVTTFPALLFDRDAGKVRPTPNLATLERAAERLRASGRSDIEVNAPGTTSLRALQVLADGGATQVEPGHALTGTTPWHAVADLPEQPAMLYVSEVSHRHGGRAYFFGGGLYVDPVIGSYQARALVGADPDAALSRRVDAFLPPPEAIDYYGQLDADARPGDTVLLGFRAQAFVTRALVAPIAGVAAGTPRVEGIWAASGRPAGGWS